jgi:hypothetical protein
MEVDPGPPTTIKQNTTEPTLINEIQHLITSAAREGFDRLCQENQEHQERQDLIRKEFQDQTRKELQDLQAQLVRLSQEGKEQQERDKQEAETAREEAKVARRLINQVLECLSLQPRTKTTYAAAASGNLPIQPRQENGGAPSRGSIPIRTTFPATNPRAETDIRVWIKNEAARKRLGNTTSGQMVKTINT